MQNHEKVPYAGFWSRLLAHNIDLLPILGLFYLTTLLPTDYSGIWVLGGIYVLYHTLFEISTWQASPGKKWSRIRVTNSDTGKTIPYQPFIRNSLKILSLVLLFGGFIMILLNRRRQALHDYISGTLVLFEED